MTATIAMIFIEISCTVFYPFNFKSYKNPIRKSLHLPLQKLKNKNRLKSLLSEDPTVNK